jgi:hypothetical protein
VERPPDDLDPTPTAPKVETGPDDDPAEAGDDEETMPQPNDDTMVPPEEVGPGEEPTDGE